jgi:GAF domain-containing protein
MVVSTGEPDPLPPDTEAHLVHFTELVATAIANGEASEALERLADEQSALRRVATLVAENVPSTELFRAVACEVGALLGAEFAGMIRYENDATVTTVATWAAQGEHPDIPGRWTIESGDPATMIAEGGEPARVNDWTSVPGQMAAFIRDELGVSSSVGCPIVVEGRLWGALAVHSKQPGPLPSDTESRLLNFTELVATAIANTTARAEVARLAQEQAALRRVATLVAREASQVEVFTAIAKEIGKLLGTEETRMLRYEGHSAVVLARWGRFEKLMPIGFRFGLDHESAAALVFRTGQPARIDYGTATGLVAERARSASVRWVAATPIIVEGRLWGAMVTGTDQDAPLPPETEVRLAQFTELMATAIANTESHARAERLAEEQAALRRVATLVAKESSPAEVFAKVAEELANVVGDVDCALARDEGDGTVTTLAAWGEGMLGTFRIGERLPVDGTSVVASVIRERRPCRIDDYSETTGTIAERGREHGIRSAAGCPILVAGRTWGVVAVARYDAEPIPPEAETRITQFAELAGTAIANAAARAEVERLAEEQAALRRVAMLVAEGVPPTTVFDAVAAEMERLLDADQVALSRYEPGNEITVVAHRGSIGERIPPGTRFSHERESVTAIVQETERPARIDHTKGTHGAIAEFARSMGVRVGVGAPIVVDGRLWGVMHASWSGEHSPPADTEERIARFAQLLDSAIANADSRDQLIASRARLVTTADETRRRVVRDLHDGAQQRLVQSIVTLKMAQRALEQDDREAESLVAEALEQAERGNAELRALAHGILPTVLTRGGLRAGVDLVLARIDLPVQVDVPADRFAPEIEASAYFIVAEALTNVVKHSLATRAEVRAFVGDGMLHIEVRDDGIGGADPDGHGLVGLGDRAAALGGRLKVESPAGGGTLVTATLPVDAA